MKIELPTPEDRGEIQAVLGRNNSCLFFKRKDGSIMYIDANGVLSTVVADTLEDVLNGQDGRRALYKGDTVTLTF